MFSFWHLTVILTFGFLSCSLPCAATNNGSSLGITHHWFNTMFSFLNQKGSCFCGIHVKIGYYFECIPKGWRSDCDLGEVTYWPEHVIIMKQLLMFCMVWVVMGLVKHPGARLAKSCLWKQNQVIVAAWLLDDLAWGWELQSLEKDGPSRAAENSKSSSWGLCSSNLNLQLRAKKNFPCGRLSWHGLWSNTLGKIMWLKIH